MDNRVEGIVRPGADIEAQSFAIIEREVGQHGYDPLEWIVVRRIIHTTADFEYARITLFSSGVVERAREAFHGGSPIYVDTRMIAVGLSPWRLGWYGLRVEVPSDDLGIMEFARRHGITRSAAAFRMKAEKLNGSVVVVGNAPTALMEIVRAIEEGIAKPALVVGVPVGFVQASESKEMLIRNGMVPFVVTKGRKGGSTVAVAILHGLLECARLIDEKGL